MESALETLSPTKLKSLILLGDFNVDFLSPSDPLQEQIQSISDKLSLKQVITAPTRVTPTTSTIIDHVYLSENLSLSSCNILPPLSGSDHNSVAVSLQLFPPYKKATRRKIWLYQNADFETANDTLQCFPSALFPDDDVNAYWTQWFDLFMTTMDKCIPTKNISSHRRLPYISKELVILIRKKVRLYKQAVRLNTSNSWLKYNKARNRATSALRKAKQSFFTNLSNKIRSPKDFWSAYHKLSPKHHRIPEDLSYLSQTARDPSEKANLLNHFFCSCFNDNTPSMLSTPAPVPTDTPTLSTISCTDEEVFHLLSTYKSRTASGPDGISSIMLRNTAASTALPEAR